MPLCDRSTTTCAPLPLASSTAFCSSGSLMPKVQSGTMWRGFAKGGKGNACPTIANRNAVDRLDHVGAKTGSPKSAETTFCATKSIRPYEILLDDLLHAFGAEGELPVPGHDIHAERLAASTMSWPFDQSAVAAALPRVAAVEQQRAGARGLEVPDQRGEVGESADLAVRPRGLRKVEMGEGVRLLRSPRHPVALRSALRRDAATCRPRPAMPRLTFGSRKWMA